MKISKAFFVVISIAISLSVLITGTISYIGTLKLFEKENLQKNQIIITQFANSISNDLLSGSNVEVFKKCQIFLSHNSISEIKISSTENGNLICNLKKQTNSSELNALEHTIYFDDQNTNPAYLILANFSNNNIKIASKFIFLLSIFSTFLSLLFGSYFAKQFSDKLIEPIVYLANLLKNGRLSEIANLKFNPTSDKIHEIKLLFESTKEMSNKLIAAQQQVLQITKNNAIAEVASQVAHDIRSPLAALNMITKSLNEIPEDKRLMIRNSIQRINDIANDLLTKGKQQKHLDDADNNIQLPLNNNTKKNPENILVPVLIDNIVSEKRIQFRDKISVNINVDLKNSFGLFVNTNPNELSRVISNLINNSVEALPNQSGNIDVSVFCDSDNNVCIQIKDNGSGIPKHILAKLGQAGVTHGKEHTQSGSGLGVYHAMKTIQEFGGQIKFHSVTAKDLVSDGVVAPANAVNKTGTTITIELPKADTPSWFADSIQLISDQEFVTVDDDISIHQIWKGRLQSLKSNEQNIKLTSFTSAKEFREYFKRNSNVSPNSTVIFLIDYEFLNQNDNGLKIITELGIQDKAILVTSRFDEPHIRNECESQKIKILPKQLAGQIPIEIQSIGVINMKNNMKQSKYDLCLIDDDKQLVHFIWGMVAKEKGLSIKMFSTPEEFLSEVDSMDKTTPIYVDVSLGKDINGADFAKDIHRLGFENINLATGYEADSMNVPDFVRSVVGKDFPI